MYRILFIASILLAVHCEKLVLVGGALADDNEAVYSKFIELSTVDGESYIGVVTGASDPADAQDNGLFYVNILKKYGATDAEWIPIHLNNTKPVSDPSWVSKVNKMTGIFFGGGDQSRLLQILYSGSGSTRKDVSVISKWQTPLLAAIRQNVATSKTAIAGSSAGTTIQQKTPMVTGGYSYYALKYPSQTTVDKNGDLLSYDLAGGFGFLSHNLYIDTHFGQRGRQGRMVALISDLQSKTNIPFGAGIDENTALVIEGDHATILGANGVSLFDLRNAKGSRKNGQLDIRSVRLTYLTNGDEFDLKKFDIYRYDCGKTHLKGHERHQSPKSYVTDAFNSPDKKNSLRNLKSIVYPGEFTLVAQDLFDSSKYPDTKAFSYETKPEYMAYLQKDTLSAAYCDIDNQDNISFEKLLLDIYPTPKGLMSQILDWLLGNN